MAESSIAILCPSWVGDTVMATPVLRAARQARAGDRIIAACRPGLDELLAGLPWIDETIALPSDTARGAWRMVRRLRAQRPAIVIVLPNSHRSALVARLSGASCRVGYRRSGRGLLLTRRLDPPPRREPVPAVDYYARLAAFALGLNEIDTRLELAVTAEQAAEARRLLEGVPRPFVLLCPGANKPAKRWPAERFAAVADALAERCGLAAVVTGSPRERDVARALAAAAAAPVHDLVKSGVTLGALKGVVAEARLVVTNDTGPRLVAAALGIPTVTLFGPTDPRWTTVAGVPQRLVVAEPFLPQELAADDHPGRCSISRIPVSDVVASAARLLAETGPAAPEARDASPAPTPPP